MVSCVSWRALGGLDCGRPSPALGSTAVSILCVTRWQSASGMIEWLCIQERWNPDVAIIFFASARYFRAKVNRSDYDAHPYNSTLHTKATRPHTGFVESPAIFVYFMALRFSGVDTNIYFSRPTEAEGGTGFLSRRAGFSEISWWILSLVKSTLHRQRAGIEPQRASPFI